MRGAVVYISSNREKPAFEEKIIQDMLSKKAIFLCLVSLKSP